MSGLDLQDGRKQKFDQMINQDVDTLCAFLINDVSFKYMVVDVVVMQYKMGNLVYRS